MSGGRSDPSSGTAVRRRAVLSGLGSAVTGSLLASTASGSNGGVELAAPELPVWTQTDQFQEVTTKYGGKNRSVVLDSRRAAVTRSVSQVNMKLWDDDDVVVGECSGGGTSSVGHQHRFVATTKVATVEELPLNYYHAVANEREWSRIGTPPRIPVTRGRHAQESLQTNVRVNSNPCDPVTFRINAVNDVRIPAGQFSPDSALLTDDRYAYDAGNLASDVRKYAGQSDPSPYMPESSQGLSGVASSFFTDVGQTAASGEAYLSTAQKIGSSAFDATTDLASTVGSKASRLEDLFGSVGDKAGYAGLAVGAYDVLKAIARAGKEPYLDAYDWSDNRVEVKSTESNGGIAVQFVDFTVTVPPGASDTNGLTVDISQSVSVEDLVTNPGKRQLVAEQQGLLPDDQLMKTVDWELEIPSYDVDDVRSIPDTPTAYVLTGDRSVDGPPESPRARDFANGASGLFHGSADRPDRTPFASAPAPEFDVSVSPETLTESDTVSFSVDGYDDDGNSTYRWRIYKLGGVVKPYVHYGRSGEIGSNVLSRDYDGVDRTLHTFGPGSYAAELTIRNRFGKVSRESAGFEVTPRAGGVEGTEIALDSQFETVELGETLSVDVTGTVGRDGTPGSLDRVEWHLEYPAAVSGGVRNKSATITAGDGGFDSTFDPNVDLRPIEGNGADQPPKTEFEHTFERPGLYKLSILAFSVPEKETGDRRENEIRWEYYNTFRRTKKADRRDLTVAVVDR